VRGRFVAAAAVAALLLLVGSGSAASRVGTFTGYAFDACTAPSTSALTAWQASPYRGLGIYVGGVNRACKDGNLSASWVTSVLASGWSLLPLYVGLQAPCVGQSGLQLMSATSATAANQGRAAADDAVSRASVFGLPVGSPIYFDMEGYSTTNASCTKAVQSFVTAWTAELHALGYVPGVYGSAASTIRDVAALGSTLPDAAWIANWNGVESVFGDPYVSDTLWTNHQRVHQYKGGHKETWGGVTINIDSNVVDGPVVGGNAAPPPPPPEPPAGSVGSGDSRATATWPSGAFPTTAVVTLTPTSQPPAPNGYAVQLTVTDSATSTPVARFAKAVIVHLLMTTGGLTPSYSSDGTTWKPMQLLKSAVLPSGVDTGYTIDPDGTIEIQTLVPGFFGLLPDTVPPSQPQGFAGRFVKGALVLSWQGATDNSGVIASYQLLLDGTPVSSLAAKKRRVTVRSFHAAAPTVYRVRAVDPSGIYGKPSAPVVVLPTKRPADTPRPVPRWAWALFTWQHSGGARPAAAPTKPPAWYWHWAAWRLAPFHVRR
jgi:Domain of unknown function (DUF1906)